ncbi:TetR/AcrR family transcriptional regulator [Ancylobacter defluvii]|uniref:TetR family transcriptional regulator n=1 Tax=Ancylobacter defluvii TaxID=1282440 RepID=A0A9W6NBI0_9HYPH|nr:TetR/AcrR family transcriptional regulator [Ancylobacter defluvii]MBS7589121.1 TetR/AcrR family transcriptional regulator [Ancylobacter defluvii]GLK84733.1 TetR family transcriptional regulator [Ancylobacter defluvii]
MTAKTARRRLPPAERRAMILDEALRLFAERHYAVVTVRDIAQVCEMNVGLLYHYFDSKDDLVRRALEHAIQQLMLGYEARRTQQPDPLAEILAWLESHVEIAPTLIRMVKLMADYASSGMQDEVLDALIAGFYGGEKELLEDALQRGIAAGLFQPHDISRTARRIGLMLDGIFFASTSRGDNRVAQDIRDLAEVLPGWIGASSPHALPAS